MNLPAKLTDNPNFRHIRHESSIDIFDFLDKNNLVLEVREYRTFFNVRLIDNSSDDQECIYDNVFYKRYITQRHNFGLYDNLIEEICASFSGYSFDRAIGNEIVTPQLHYKRYEMNMTNEEQAELDEIEDKELTEQLNQNLWEKIKNYLRN